MSSYKEEVERLNEEKDELNEEIIKYRSMHAHPQCNLVDRYNRLLEINTILHAMKLGRKLTLEEMSETVKI